MDVKKTKIKKTRLSTQKLLIIAAVCVGLILAWKLSQSSNFSSVKRENILVGQVKFGDLDVQIDGYGLLRSNKQKILIATSSATVEEIFLKPGAPVTPDSVIMRLSNPALKQQVANARQELQLREGDLRQLVLTNERDLLSEEAALADITAQLESEKLLRIANTELLERGIVSSLELKRVQLQESQLATRVDIQKRRYKQLKLVHQETIKNQQETINQQKGSYQVLIDLMDQLTIRASMMGVLQRSPVELGQSLLLGQQVALISSTEDLVALIKIPQTLIEQIMIGQQAVVDTRRDKIQGKITRIDPAVTEGTVTVEVQLIGKLPTSARPELNVDATILTDSLKDVLYVERPVNSRSNTMTTLFKLDDQNSAKAIQVSLGVSAGRFIQISSGTKTGDRLILSDMSKHADKLQLSIID